VARLTFDPVGCELWLDPLASHGAPVQELCTFHVDRLTVPRGWTVIDRRPGVVVAAPEPEPEPEAEAEPAGRGAVGGPEASDPPDPDDRPDDADGDPPRPPARRRPGSPLLERAFAWTGPQQSILTQPRRPDDAD
jgi:hypothetical protein